MSHTSKFTVEGTEYTVHHNSDWSGDAHISWWQGNHLRASTSVPGALFVAVSKRINDDRQESLRLLKQIAGDSEPARLRDEFALAALRHCDGSVDTIAARAYEVADAMLRWREKGKR